MLQRIGRYEILERIATGGQGTVYRARDTVLARIVAVQIINQSIADDLAYLEALQREARLAAGLEHPNITTVYDLQVEDGTPYIVMEYVPDALDRHLQGGSSPLGTHGRDCGTDSPRITTCPRPGCGAPGHKAPEHARSRLRGFHETRLASSLNTAL